MNIISDPSPHFDDRTLPISLVVLHYTHVPSFDGALDILTGRNVVENGRVSAHYAISKQGQIYSLVPEDKRAWHAGVGRYGGIDDVNSASIGIELDNQGHGHFEEFGTWPAYPPALMASLVRLLKDILVRYPHLDAVRDIVGHCHVAPHRKMDPGPHFPWQRLWQKLA